jgi:predicted RNA polymerase sigma factor
MTAIDTHRAELAQDAPVAALEQWPALGVPRNPGAWRMAAAKHRAIDLPRRNKLLERKHGELGYQLEAEQMAAPDFESSMDHPVSESRGPYALQAAIAACHATARVAEETDWERIAGLYRTLAEAAPSPVVELNRAVAIAMAFGPAPGLELVDALASEPSLKNYHLLPSVRGDIFFKLGRTAEAQLEFQRAAALTRNSRERELLLNRARDCANGL